jgi:hypothetical protein
MDTFQFCEDWHNAISDACEAIDNGEHLLSIDTCRIVIRIPNAKAPSIADFLSMATGWLCEAASVRYPWFDSQLLWELNVLVQSGAYSTPQEKIRIYALRQAAGARVRRLQEAVLVDLGLIKQSVRPEKEERTNLTPGRRLILKVLAASQRRLTKPQVLEALMKLEPNSSEATLRIELAKSAPMRKAEWIDHVAKGENRGYGITETGRAVLDRGLKPL